jgi:hypothetical protein
VAGRLASLPVIGSPLNNATRQTLDDVGERAQQVAQAYGQSTRGASGLAIRDALVDYIETGSRAPINRLYAQVDTLVNPQTLSPLPSTQRTVRNLLAQNQRSATEINNPAIDIVAEALNRPGMTYQGIRELRTTVGAMLDGSITTAPGTPMPALRQIYGALSQDLRGSVQNAGGPKALAAFERANRLNAQMAARREDLQRIVGRQGDAGGENVFETMIQMAQDRGKTANIQRLGTARRAVPADVWNDFTGSFVRRMGLDPKTGDFSPDRFLTSYGKLSDEGRRLLFNSTGRGDLAKSLNNLQRVSEQFSEFFKMGNPSGTAGASAVFAALGASVFEPLAAAGTLSAAAKGYALSRFFASPANVDKMTRTLSARMSATRNPTPANEQRAVQLSAMLSNVIAREVEKSEQESSGRH